MTDWLTSPYYELPPDGREFYMDGPFVAVRFSIEYGMGLAIDSDLKNPNYFFNNNPDLDAFYHDPLAYAKNLVAKAEALAVDKKYYHAEGWDPMESGLQYANIVFGKLKQIPCNRGDADSNNLFDSWAAGTGQLPGGNAPAPLPSSNEATGQSAAPAGSIL